MLAAPALMAPAIKLIIRNFANGPTAAKNNRLAHKCQIDPAIRGVFYWENTMALTSETTKVQYSGDDSTVAFPVTFAFWAQTDLRVIHTDSAGTETVWTRGTQYTVTGGDGSTGQITVSTSPTDYTPATGETLTIKSNLTLTQDTRLPAGGPLPSKSVEQQMDKVVRMVQQMLERIERSLLLPESSAVSDLTLPEPTAGKLLGWNDDEDALENFTPADIDLAVVSAFIETLIDDANAAAARTTLGLGTAAVKNTGTSGDVVPLLNATMNLGDNTLQRPKLLDYGETVNAIGAIGGGSQDIDLTLGNVVTGTVDTSETTFTFSNPSATGIACSFTLILTNGGSQTVNWPASVDWAGASAPTLTAAGVDILTFVTVDGGTIWYGFTAGLAMA